MPVPSVPDWIVRPAGLALAALALSFPVASQAQSMSSSGASGSSPYGWAGRGYLGLSVGRTNYQIGCGSSLLPCDDKDNGYSIYAGSMIGSFWGAELGWVDMGRVDRGGGRTKAQGLNLSLVARAPIGSLPLSAFGKVGTTYGRTESSALIGSGVGRGTEKGFGLSYGAGLSWEFTPKLAATLGWESHDFEFAGTGRDPVRFTSLGLQYRY